MAGAESELRTRRQLHVLLASARDALAEQVLGKLAEHFEVIHERVDAPEVLHGALGKQPWDAIVCDPPPGDAIEFCTGAIRAARARGIPVIVASLEADDSRAALLLQAGAQYVLDASRLDLLVPVLERELAEASAERARNVDSLVRWAPDPILIVGANGRILRVSAQAQALLGYGEDELVGELVERLVPEARRRRHAAHRAAYMDTPRFRPMGKGMEFPLVAKGGDEIPVEISLAPLEIGGQTLVVCAMRDLRERLSRLAPLLAFSPDPMVVVGANGRIVRANRLLLELLGYAESELIGEPIERLVPESLRARHSVDRALYMAAPTTRPMGRGREFSARARDGTEIPVEISLAPVQTNGERLIACALRDLRERRRAQQLMQAVLDNVDEIVYAVESDSADPVGGRVTFVSNRVEQVMGFTPAEFYADQTLWFRMLHPEDIPAVEQQTRALYTAGGSLTREYRIAHGTTGEYRSMEDRVTVQVDQQRSVARIFGVARDVTERKHAEAELRRFRLALDNSADMIALIDRKTMRYIDVNAAYSRLLGYTRDELLAMGPQDVVSVSREELEKAYDALIANPSTTGTLNGYYRCKDGSELPFEATRHALFSEDTWVIAAISRDVRERLRAAEKLHESENQLRLVTDSVPAMIAYFDADYRYAFANLSYREFHTGSSESINGKTIEEVLGAKIAALARVEIGHALAGEPRSYVREINRRGDGSLRQLDVSLVPRRDAAGKVLGVYALLLDVTRRRRAEASLRLRERAIEASVNSIMITEPAADGQKIVYVNPAFERITGYSRAEVLGKSPRFLHGKDADQRGIAELRAATRELREATVLLRNYRKDGTLFWNELHTAPVLDAAGNATHFIGISSDVTERVRYQEEIERHANYDTLTGLPNRNLANDRLAQAIVQAGRTGRSLGVMFIDLDHLKRINDSLGHAMGDKVIAAVSQRIAETLRSGDTVARIGGDEFVALLAELKRNDDVASVAAKVANCIGTPLRIDSNEFVLTASIGIAVYPKDGADGPTLLRNADTALYRAKGEGRDCFRFFAAEMNERAVQFLALENDLRKALAQNEFWLQYQPIVRMANCKVLGAEALLRWRRADGSVVSPMEFIPVAEESGLIVPVGRWVLETAMRQAAAWNRGRGAGLYVAINLSSRQFHDPMLVDTVRNALGGVRIDPGLIRLELTESAVMQDVGQSADKLKELKELGVKLAVDDFGTGYSSLAYLKRFPIDVLKIDRAFVRDLETDQNDRELSRAIISLGRALELDVVAEGVETLEQARVLAASGCEFAQGYLYGRPVDPEDFKRPKRRGAR